jgi:hypothetical protein
MNLSGTHLVVIASGAKQSRGWLAPSKPYGDPRSQAALDCFVAMLLAMTNPFDFIIL